MTTAADRPKAGLEDTVATSSAICYLDGDRGVLADATGVARLLALEGVHRLDELDGAEGPADPPAGHRVGLADAADEDRAVLRRVAEAREAAELVGNAAAADVSIRVCRR